MDTTYLTCLICGSPCLATTDEVSATHTLACKSCGTYKVSRALYDDFSLGIAENILKDHTLSVYVRKQNELRQEVSINYNTYWDIFWRASRFVKDTAEEAGAPDKRYRAGA
jgi:hypothetical protein